MFGISSNLGGGYWNLPKKNDKQHLTFDIKMSWSMTSSIRLQVVVSGYCVLTLLEIVKVMHGGRWNVYMERHCDTTFLCCLNLNMFEVVHVFHCFSSKRE